MENVIMALTSTSIYNIQLLRRLLSSFVLSSSCPRGRCMWHTGWGELSFQTIQSWFGQSFEFQHYAMEIYKREKLAPDMI